MVVGDRQVAGARALLALQEAAPAASGAGWSASVSGTDVPDTTSGFRAYNREAALQLLVVSNFTYTLESLIQAGRTLVAIEHVPVGGQPPRARVAAVRLQRRLRAPQRARRSSARFVLYKPLRFFAIVAGGLRPRNAGRLPRPSWSTSIRTGDPSGHLQSLIVAAVLALIAVQMLGARGSSAMRSPASG